MNRSRCDLSVLERTTYDWSIRRIEIQGRACRKGRYPRREELGSDHRALTDTNGVSPRQGPTGSHAGLRTMGMIRVTREKRLSP